MALKAAPADQARLLELHELDTSLQRIQHRAARLPEEAVVTELAAEGERLRRLAAEQTGAAEDAQTELKRTESDVAVVDARIARDRDRLQASSSTKDIQGLEQELTALAKRKADLEDIELAVMETVEAAQSALDATREELSTLEQRSADAVAARDAARTALDDERSDVELSRRVLVDRIPEDLLALYEKQRARYGIGASFLQGGVSSASGVALNSSDMNAVRAAAPDDVLLCPDSNAILVRTDESGLW